MKYDHETGKVEITKNDRARRAVRIHHPDLRNCTFTITQWSRRYPEAFPCPACNQLHIYKTFHLHLDNEGNATVHEEIYELFKREGMVQDLNATKEVTPAPMVIGLSNTFQPPTIISQEQGPVKLNGHKIERIPHG